MIKKWWSVDDHSLLIPHETQKGSYVILVNLINPVEINKPNSVKLDRGFYAYCGNAGKGLHQRISRHFKSNNTIWWHIDKLTAMGKVECAFWSEILIECDLAVILRNLAIIEPIKGFGSSDCKKCFSHLFYLDDNGKEETISYLAKNLLIN